MQLADVWQQSLSLHRWGKKNMSHHRNLQTVTSGRCMKLHHICMYKTVHASVCWTTLRRIHNWTATFKWECTEVGLGWTLEVPLIFNRERPICFVPGWHFLFRPEPQSRHLTSTHCPWEYWLPTSSVKSWWCVRQEALTADTPPVSIHYILYI